MERWGGGEATFQRPNKIRGKDGTADLSVDPIKGRTWMHYGLGRVVDSCRLEVDSSVHRSRRIEVLSPAN